MNNNIITKLHQYSDTGFFGIFPKVSENQLYEVGEDILFSPTTEQLIYDERASLLYWRLKNADGDARHTMIQEYKYITSNTRYKVIIDCRVKTISTYLRLADPFVPTIQKKIPLISVAGGAAQGKIDVIDPKSFFVKKAGEMKFLEVNFVKINEAIFFLSVIESI